MGKRGKRKKRQKNRPSPLPLQKPVRERWWRDKAFVVSLLTLLLGDNLIARVKVGLVSLVVSLFLTPTLSVRIISPSNGATFAVGETLELRAEVSGPNIKEVAFYRNDQLIGTSDVDSNGLAVAIVK